MRRLRQVVPERPARFSRARLPQRGQRVRLWPGWTDPSCARWWDATLGAGGDGRHCRNPSRDLLSVPHPLAPEGEAKLLAPAVLLEIIERVPLPVFAEGEAVFRPSHREIGLGSLEKVECLGSGADAKAAAGVPDVCPDCVRGENE